MANGRIDVYFHEGGTDVSSPTDNVGDKKKQTKQELEKQAIMHQVVNYAKKSVIESVNTFSNFTGSYKAQRMINGVTEMASTALMLSQFPVGTIAAVTDIISKGVGGVLNIIQSNREAELLLKRSGNEATNESGHS